MTMTDDKLPPGQQIEPAAQRLPDNLMAELAKIIGEQQQVPAPGTVASANMRACFDRVAEDILALGAEHVRRADDINQRAVSFASTVQKMGDLLCAQIEREAVRGYKISKALHATRAMVEDTELGEEAPAEEASEPPRTVG